MSENGVQRRLAAILAADVVGYSKMMGQDEAGTLVAVRRLRAEVIEPKIAEHQGRLFKSMGDGFLVEFPSVVNAVACAATIQKVMAAQNADQPEGRWIQLRIGVNLGDVVVDGDDVFGDGVNVAARLEGIAMPGEIVVAASVHDQIGNRLDLAFEDMGEQQLKNIAMPLRAYRLASKSRPVAQVATVERTKPSIAVLPFTNMSGDAEQEYFSDGITEDIITELSRFRNLFVIARNSSFTYKGRAVDVKKVGKELGVDFVVEGSVRRLGGRIRITAQLINAANGSHVWAERYDRPFDEIFDLQDEVVTTIAATAEGRVASAVADHADTRRNVNLAAYEAVLQARQLLATYQTEAAELLLRKALIVDPNYAQAYAWLSWIEMIKFFYDLSAETISDAATLGKKAVAADQNDSQCHVSLAFAYLFQKKFDLADIESKRAIELNPTDTLAVNARAQWLSRAGFAEEALRNLEDVLRRDPFPPSWHWGNRATAFLCLERYEDAIAAINRKSRTFWWDHYMRGVCYYYLDNINQAQAEIADMLRERPTVTITDILIAEPYRNAEDQQRLSVGLRGVGLPE